jgi:hypothetical protein
MTAPTRGLGLAPPRPKDARAKALFIIIRSMSRSVSIVDPKHKSTADYTDEGASILLSNFDSRFMMAQGGTDKPYTDVSEPFHDFVATPVERSPLNGLQSVRIREIRGFFVRV